VTEILVALIGFGGTVLAVVLPLMWKAHGRRLDAITEQVSNSHGSNLRDDLDFIRDLVLDVKADTAWNRRETQDLTIRVKRLEDAA
jgi:hypothetical protein